MKTLTIQIESTLSNTDALHLARFYCMLQQMLNTYSLKGIILDSRYWFVYRGGSHVAIHEMIEGKPAINRLLFITE